MFDKLLKNIIGSKTDREARKLIPAVDSVNAACQGLDALSDEELRGKTDEFKARLADGETLDDLMSEAFAVVKEACRRLVGKSWDVVGLETTWDMVPYDVQLMGAIVLHQGQIAEMATGEGKTLVATMPLYLNALPGRGAHLVTVNDYLARRDAEWMGARLRVPGPDGRVHPDGHDARGAQGAVLGATSRTGPTTSSASTTCATTWRSASRTASSATISTPSSTRSTASSSTRRGRR